MIVEEVYSDEKEVLKVISLFCGNGAVGVIRDRDVEFTVRFKQIMHEQVFFASVEGNTEGVALEDYHMRPLDCEVSMGANIYLMQAVPMSNRSISIPDTVKAHPKRKHPRIKVAGNSFISKMFAQISIKVVDFTVQDEELSKKIHLIISTIESHLVRSENYDIAKVSLFDGTEKNIVTRLIKKTKRPFVVFDTANFRAKDEMVLGYEDYIRYLIEEGYKRDDIMSQLDRVKEFYQKNRIQSEAILPLVFEDEAIGQIRVVSLKEKIAKANVRRLITLASNAVDDLFDKCSFEIMSKEPQIILDLSVGGGKYMITEPEMYKYLRLMKRIYLQLFFPDETMIKTMATVINLYPDSDDGYKVIGVKFSANMDWRDKQKLDDFIQSVMRLQGDKRTTN